MRFFLPLLLFFSFLFPYEAIAASSYVLPYPSSMPGSKFYMLSKLSEKASRYWYFGNLGQFAYNLKEADKYLVQAKTLFEYNQYLLAVSALHKSDEYFSLTPTFLNRAKKENKDVSDKEKILQSAAEKHIEVLKSLENVLPETFLWEPEKSQPQDLPIRNDIQTAIKIRMRSL